METKRFSEISDEELLSMSPKQIEDSIKVEAIQRGIQPRITLSELIAKMGYNPCVHFPSENDTIVWSLNAGYSNACVGWVSQEQAEAALKGAIYLGTSYRNGRSVTVIENQEIQLVQVRIPAIETKVNINTPFKEFTEQTPEEFDRLVEECMDKLVKVRLDHYILEVARERKAEYLRLAGGNEGIAKAFWAKAESLKWPEDP